MHSHNTLTPWHPWLRPIARLLIGALLCHALLPLSALAQQGAVPVSPTDQAQMQRLRPPQQRDGPGQSARTRRPAPASERIARNLALAHSLVRALAKPVAAPGTGAFAIKSASGQASEQQQLRALVHAIDADTDMALAEFHASRADLIEQQVGPEILARHDQAEAQLRIRAQTLRQRLRAWQSHPDEQNLGAIGQFFEQYPAARARSPLNPGELPWGTPRPTTAEPASSQAAWHQSLYADQKVLLAQAGTTIAGIRFDIPPAPGTAPDVADLAPTAEVTLSRAIQAKAAQLGNNPVLIDNWVRNTVEFLPTWGALQNADSTLQTLRGNAFDIASLHIALLRAAKIPARYQFGTIELPADKVQNWVGGTANAQAALNLLHQGGIAATGLARGGAIERIRMEHVWVQAYVNWSPGRGHRQGGAAASPPIRTPDAHLQHVNPNAHLNAWVPLDASYKQYRYTSGLDIRSQVPQDASALLSTARHDDSTIDTAQGWVRRLNHAGIRAQLDAYQDRALAYIQAQKPNASLADVFGHKRIIAWAPDVLAGATPYAVVLQGPQTTVVPDALRWAITFKLYASANDKADGAPLLSQSVLFSDIGSRRITAEGVAASSADQALIGQYAANATALPLYLIRQKTRLKLDDRVLAESGPQRMGDPQWWSYVLTGPHFGSVEEDFKFENAVGDAIAFSVDATGIRCQDALDRAAAVAPDTALENLHQFGLGYWSRANEAGAIMANASNVIAYRLPSIGLFTSPLSVTYSWGIPRTGQYRSYAVDIRRMSAAVTGVANPAATREYLLQTGARNSFLEGRIFEEMLGLAPGAAASAVSVIAAANDQGVALWQLHAGNLQQYLAVTTVSASMQQQVASAVANRLDVLAPQAPVQLMRWSGQGFIATDPQTGAGAYIIDGVGNGGELVTCEESAQPLAESIAQRILTGIALSIAAALLAVTVVSLPPATPALVSVMVMLGISSLTFSAHAAPNPCDKGSKDCHRGRFQAQGGKGGRSGVHAEESTKWGQAEPLTKQQALVLVEQLEEKLTRRQWKVREDGFLQLKAFIKGRPAGGVCKKDWSHESFPKPNKNERGIRVDVEVWAGQAFKD
ncbi:transglutaminase family protein [Verminephrobacter eiseniae]|uniref:transglutaminase-like domain-containing protein n=1 Tax=Verminephrobacter eiseniae TaxID=364317 RepID=UPI002236FD20|nr:transglutaminase family protein [Verminephrobacter eiseniae]MCW5258818.1 transglutaminase family protein [Verminephrobacter eiseniae]